MLQFLGSGDTWRTLRSISRHRNCPLWVAAPFLGDGGGKLLYLKRGDILVVALTIGNARNGSVCPDEIKRLQKNGVQVFLAPNLHAKVLLCGSKAVVGSANLSYTSFTHLDEAALLTTDAKIVKHVRVWFQQRMLEAVSPKWLAVCAKAYRPPRGGFGQRGERTAHATGKAVWLLGIEFTDYPENEAAIAERGLLQAKRQLSDAKFKAETIRWTGKNVSSFRKGDTVIQVIQASRSHYAEELARLIGIHRTIAQNGKQVAYLYLESRKRPRHTQWGKFKRGCLESGLTLGKTIGMREIASPAQAAKIMALVSRR
jgi:hypothetical protein